MRFESPVITSHKTGPVKSLTDYVSRSRVNMVLNCSNNWDSASVIKISSLNRINIHSPHTDKACSYKNTNMMRCLSVSVRTLRIKSHYMVWRPQSQLWQHVSLVKEPAFKEQWRKKSSAQKTKSHYQKCAFLTSTMSLDGQTRSGELELTETISLVCDNFQFLICLINVMITAYSVIFPFH